MTAPEGLRLTDKGRALFTRLNAFEAALAAIWREPFETYDPAQRLAWSKRRNAATEAFRAAMQELDDAVPTGAADDGT